MMAIEVTIARRMQETNRSAATRLSRMSVRSRLPSTGCPLLSACCCHHPVSPDRPEGPRLAPGVLNLPARPVLDFTMGAEQARPLDDRTTRRTLSQLQGGTNAKTPSTERRTINQEAGLARRLRLPGSRGGGVRRKP